MTDKNIPVLMKAVLQDKAGGKLYIKEIPVPKPGKGEVLIRMAVSPINPSDLSLLNGSFNIKPSYPLIPGIEGSGVVVESGKGLLPQLRSGKRVSCSSTKGKGGTWSEYIVTSAMQCVPLGKNVSLEQGSMMLVNPLTALAFIDIIRDEGHKAFVNNAAASALGKMLVNLSIKYNIPLINIVRKQEQADMLIELGASLVLNSEEPDFKEKLIEHSRALNATIFLDAIGGEQTTIMAEASPPGSTILVYAKLSENEFKMDSRLILQADKTIKGFSLPVWNRKRTVLQKLRSISKVQSLLRGELQTNVKNRFSLDQVNDAIDYYRAQMTGGKTILVIGPETVS